MALVAYSDDSDLGTDSEEGEEICAEVEKKENLPSALDSPETKVKPFSSVETEESKVVGIHNEGIDSIIDEDEDNAKGSDRTIVEDEEYRGSKGSGMFSSIPAARPIPVASDRIDLESDEVLDVPTVDTWKVTQEIKKGSGIESSSNPQLPMGESLLQKKKERRKVQFIVPALSEFADEEDEVEPEEPKQKKLKPSTSGTGLFSLLPNPKHLAVKETKRSLLPNVLTKRQVPTPKPRPKPKPKQENKKPVSEDISDDDDDDDEEGGSSDFFSLSEPALDLKPVSEPLAVVRGEIIAGPDTGPVSRTHTFEMEIKNQSKPEMYPENSEVSEHPPHYYDDEAQHNVETNNESYIPVASASQQPGIDEEAMVRLAGKRRGKGEVINFIDVSADDALLTRQEWMTKALTEEKPTHGYSKKREGLPSQKQKQKHQITFLAHQAKERELELKNNWAQNRMTKMQTQAKYGF